MAGHSYVNKGYSTYTDVPAQEGGYVHGQKQYVNWYVVEITTIERIRAPATRYINFGDQEDIHAPSTFIRPTYVPKDRIEGYEPDYGSDYENSSPPRYRGRESLMDKFRNKVQIKASQPVKTNNISSLNRTGNLSGLNKYQPTIPVHNYPSEETHLIRNRNLSGPNKYRPTSPVHTYPSEEAHLNRTQNLSSPNKYRPTSPVHSYPSEESDLIRTRNLSGPNKNHPSSPGSEGGRHGKTGHFPVPNNHWQSAGPPTTHHPLTTSTNDINEALRFLEESVNYSPHSGPKSTGVFNNSSPRPQSIEPERRYAKPIVGATTQPHSGTNIIDSREAIKKYKGARVP